MRKFVVGFMFDETRQNVCMIRKNRPDWQKGFLNGIGGHVELKESPIKAMVREFYEETGVATTRNDWHHVCTLRFSYAIVDFFVGSHQDAYLLAETMTDEEILRLPISAILENSYPVIENIPSLLVLSQQRLIDREGVRP